MKIFTGTNKKPTEVCVYIYPYANNDTLIKNIEVRFRG